MRSVINITRAARGYERLCAAGYYEMNNPIATGNERTLVRVEQNDTTLQRLSISESIGGSYGDTGRFSIYGRSSVFSRLGVAVGRNTHLRFLYICLRDFPLGPSLLQGEFFEGLKRNTSIRSLSLHCDNRSIVGGWSNGLGHEILKVYQENSNLTNLTIEFARDVENGGDLAIAAVLRSCPNMKQLWLEECNVTGEQLLPIVEAMRGHMLQDIYLGASRIGDTGCEAIATLLEHPNCNIRKLLLSENAIGNVGAIAIANSLVNNTKMKHLDLSYNPMIIQDSAMNAFCDLLCNRSSIGDTYSSNHTLEELELPYQLPYHVRTHLKTLVDLNRGTDKIHVATKKILKYHPYIDMEPLFGWDAEGEHTLKALPNVIDWFAKAEEGFPLGELGEIEVKMNIDRRKLSALYQFAKAMPLMFIPNSHNREGCSNKRKRGGNSK